MKTLVSWSSGKDSAWALHRLRASAVEPCGLLTTINEAANRVAMHAVREELLQAQANAAGLPLHIVRIPSPCANDEYAARMGAFVRDAAASGVTHMAFGDLFLEDVRRYREQNLAGTGITPVFPLWGLPTAPLAADMLDAGMRAVLTCIDPRKLDASFAGREFNRALLVDLPPGIDPCGENGEFHSFVWDGPMFTGPIPVERGVVVERDGFVFADLVRAATPAR